MGFIRFSAKVSRAAAREIWFGVDQGEQGVRRAAMAFGMALVRTWPSSSCSVTSQRQSSRFSTSYHPAGAPVGRRGRPAGVVDW